MPWRHTAGIRLAAALVLCVAALAACSSDEPLVVGFTGPLEGKYSDLGTQGRNGLMLALETINETGGAGGRTLRLVTRDDGATPESARVAVRALLESGARVVVGHMTSGQSMAGYPVAEAAGVPMLSPTTSTPLLAGKEDLFFRTIPVATDWARGLAEYSARNAGITRVASITDMDNAAYTVPFNEAFAEAFVTHGGEPPQEIRVHSSRIDSWDDVADEIQRMGVPALEVALSARDLAALARIMRKRGMDIPVFSAMWAYTRELLLAGGKSAEGIVFAVSYTPGNTSERYRAFQERYRKRFGWAPNFAAAFGYDCGLVLARALERAGGDPQRLPATLADTGPIEGVMGEFALDANGDVERSSFIVTIENRRFKTIGSIR